MASDFTKEEWGLIVDPEVYPNQYSDDGFYSINNFDFLIVASDGLWDIMINQKVVEVINDMPEEIRNQNKISEYLIVTAANEGFSDKTEDELENLDISKFKKQRMWDGREDLRVEKRFFNNKNSFDPAIYDDCTQIKIRYYHDNTTVTVDDMSHYQEK